MTGRVRDAVRLRKRSRRFFAQTRPSDVFIVGYPKSGTTWLAYMIANVLEPEPPRALSFDDLEEFVPDVNSQYFTGGSLGGRNVTDPRFFAVHAPYEPGFPKVVYVLRDPRDVMVSYYHHRQMVGSIPETVRPRTFIDESHWPTDWGTHVEGWLDSRHPRLLVVTYEEMIEDPERQLSRVLEFAGIEATTRSIAKAAVASSFEEMRKVEDHFGIPGLDTALRNERFVRRGEVGSWLDEFDDATVAAIDQRFGALMESLGYEPSAVAAAKLRSSVQGVR